MSKANQNQSINKVQNLNIEIKVNNVSVLKYDVFGAFPRCAEQIAAILEPVLEELKDPANNQVTY